MKSDLTDITFIILIRLDSVQRLENIITITDSIYKYFNTQVVVIEAASYNNKILKSLLHKKIEYQFIEDKDPILYKTKYYNIMAKNINTPYIAIWDADIVIDKKAVICSINQLRENNADISFPYNGICFNTSDIIRSLYLKNKNIKFLYKNINKMDYLYEKLLVGGAVLLNRDQYIYAGLENERHYGWGNDDFDRYYRFVGLNLRVFRNDNCLFHLSHPRSINSYYRTSLQKTISKRELFKIEDSSKNELLKMINNFHE